MRLRIELTVEDLVAFSLYHHQRSPTLRRSRFWAVIAIGLMIAAMSHVAAEVLQRPLIRPVGIVAAVFFAAIYPSIWRRKVRQYLGRLYREGQNRGVLGTHTLEILGNGLYDETPFYERTTFWNGIERIETAPGRTFVYLSAVSAMVIAENSATEGDYAAFIEELQKQWRQHNDQQ